MFCARNGGHLEFFAREIPLGYFTVTSRDKNLLNYDEKQSFYFCST